MTFCHRLIYIYIYITAQCTYWAVQWSWFEWVNAICNLLRKKSREVAASLPGQFLSRRFWVVYNKGSWTKNCEAVQMPLLLQLQKKLPWKKDGGWKKKCLCIVFLAYQKIASSWKKWVLGYPIARATSYCLLPDTFWLRASKNVFKVGSVKFANSLSPPSIVKKVRTGSKSSQGT